MTLFPDSRPPELAALYVRKNTIYHAFPGVDCWDVERNARHWPGGCPVIAHPPCAQWGVLKWSARKDEAEKHLALLAVEQVRQWCGVLEHPKGSDLWPVMKLPRPGAPADAFGGWTLAIDQWRFGHRALKPTWLYIVGCSIEYVPALPPVPDGRPPACVGFTKGKSNVPHIAKDDRDKTPRDLAAWLVELARRCGANKIYQVGRSQL